MNKQLVCVGEKVRPGQAPDGEELGSHAEAVEFLEDRKEYLMVFCVV